MNAAGSGERCGGTVESHAGKPVETDELDQGLDVRLRAPQQNGTPAAAQAPGEHRQIDHQRGVRERELSEVDDDIHLCTEGPYQRRAPQALGGPILIPDATQDRRVVGELDDGENLQNLAVAVANFKCTL